MKSTATYKTALKSVSVYQRILKSLSELDEIVGALKTLDAGAERLLRPYREDIRARASRLAGSI